MGSGFRVWGLWFRVWGLGFRVWGLGFRVWGLGFKFRAPHGRKHGSMPGPEHKKHRIRTGQATAPT